MCISVISNCLHEAMLQIMCNVPNEVNVLQHCPQLPYPTRFITVEVK